MSSIAVRARAVKELIEARNAGTAGLFVGAGASAGSGLPTWKGMLAELIDLLDSQPGTSADLTADAKVLLATPAKWLILAQLLKSELGKAFDNYIIQRFADPASKPNKIHENIVDSKWQVLVTTNYDRLIEKAFAQKLGARGDIPVFTYQDAPRVASCFRRGEQFVLKAHGDAREAPDYIILTESDYRKLVHAQIGYQTILQAIFTTTSFLFLGCSLSDPDLRLLLSFLHSAFHGDTPRHYALIPSDQRLNAEDRVFSQDFNIHVVPIDPGNKERDILKFLNELKSKPKK